MLQGHSVFARAFGNSVPYFETRCLSENGRKNATLKNGPDSVGLDHLSLYWLPFGIFMSNDIRSRSILFSRVSAMLLNRGMVFFCQIEASMYLSFLLLQPNWWNNRLRQTADCRCKVFHGLWKSLNSV